MKARETREAIVASARPKRVPLHEQRRDRFTVDKDPNYTYRIVNDTEDRIDKFKLAGWELDPRENVKIGESAENNVSLGTGAKINVGGGTHGILMRIPKELYEEDQKVKQREILEKEKSMKRNKNQQGEDGTYGEVVID